VRLEIACTQNTADQEAVQRKQRFLNDIFLPVQSYDQQLKQQLLASGLSPEGFSIPLRNLRTEATLFREINLPLLNEEENLSSEYLQVNGAQMVTWEGKEVFMDGHSTILSTPLQLWARSKSGTTIYVIHTLRSNSIVTRFLWEQQEPFQSFSRLPESSLPSMRRLSKGCCNRLCKPLRNWKQGRINGQHTKEKRSNLLSLRGLKLANVSKEFAQLAGEAW